MKDDLIKRSGAMEAVCEGCLSIWETCQYSWDCPALTNLAKLPSADRPNATEIMNAYHEGVRKGIAEAYEADKPQGWIPCSERLPEEGGMYLASVKKRVLDNDYYRVEVAYCSPKGNWLYVSSKSEVLAWMPLPEPWKGANDGKD